MEEFEKKVQNMKKKFYESIQEINKRINNNTKFLPKEAYLQTIELIKSSKANNVSIPFAVYRQCGVRGVDVTTVNGVDRLFVLSAKDTPKYFVHMDEMFQIIFDTHVEHGHCGRNRMEKEINIQYKNITREILRNFLSLCFICDQRRPAPVKSGIERNRLHGSNFDVRFPRCQVNVIGSKYDGAYKYILIYEDYLTKFIQLRPLKTCSTKEIAASLLRIFATFGAPAIIHSEDGRDFASNIVREISNHWNEIKMVHGKSQVSSLNNDVMELINLWIEKNQLSKWSKCLHYVQLMKNKSYHKAIDGTPFEAMFGVKCKIGLSCDDLATGNIDKIETEEDLKMFVRQEKSLKIKLDTDDSNCDDGSVDCFENYLKSLKQETTSDEEDEKEPRGSNCNDGSIDGFENYLKSLKQEIASDEEDENEPPSKNIKLSN